MNRVSALGVFFFSFLLLAIAPAAAQPDERIRMITLVDGSEIIGTITAEDSTTVDFTTVSGVEMKLRRAQIRSIDRVRGEVVDGTYRYPDPNGTRLFFAPTGRALEAGQVYFAAYEIFLPFVGVGLTDFLTIGGGLSLMPGAESQIFYLTPKVRALHLEKFDLSAGLLVLGSFGDGGLFDGMATPGIVYAVGTYGTQDLAVTLGGGWAFAGEEIADKPILTIGAEARLSKSVKLLTENWIPIGAEVAIFSLGVRFFGENLAADIGLFRPTLDMDGFPFIPWLGFAYNFSL